MNNPPNANSPEAEIERVVEPFPLFLREELAELGVPESDGLRVALAMSSRKVM